VWQRPVAVDFARPRHGRSFGVLDLGRELEASRVRCSCERDCRTHRGPTPEEALCIAPRPSARPHIRLRASRRALALAEPPRRETQGSRPSLAVMPRRCAPGSDIVCSSSQPRVSAADPRLAQSQISARTVPRAKPRSGSVSSDWLIVSRSLPLVPTRALPRGAEGWR